MKTKNSPSGTLLSRIKFPRISISLGKKTKIKILKKALLTLALVALFCFAFVQKTLACREGIVINEIYGGGGNSGSLYKNDFIELYNFSGETVFLDGWKIGYASSSSENFSPAFLSGKIAKNGSYLIGANQGSGGSIELPVQDAFFQVNLSATAGKIAIWNEKNERIDFVGYGGANSFEGEKPAISPNNLQSISRKNFCDSEDNSKDFEKTDPTPKSSFFENEDVEEEKDEEEKLLICEKDIFLNEIYPYLEEFVELQNLGENPCLLEGWSISDSLGSEGNMNHRKFFEKSIAIEPEGFATIFGNLFLNDDGDSVKLFNSKGNKIEEIEYLKGEKQKSFSKFDEEWRWTPFVTKGAENMEEVFEEAEEQKEGLEAKGKIFINEILPNPSGDETENEWIEIFNSSDEDINLKGWSIKDSSKSGKFVFKEDVIIKKRDFLVAYRKETKIALNNSGGEKVSLFDQKGRLVSEVSFSGSAKENISYAFDGEKWRWTKHLTPGKENVFGKTPKIEIRYPKKTYVGMFADFEAKIKNKNDDQIKLTWNFGDKRRSYKQKTRHKYLQEGEFEGFLKISNGAEDFFKKFKISVEKYPRFKVKMVSFNVNPFGRDSEFETITIKNESKKKVNLKGWSVANGWERMVNHPIREDFEIKPGESRELSRKDSLFVLNNLKAKIELRYPDGEVADKVKYKNEKSIKEGLVYEKTNGGWEWKSVQIDKDVLNVEDGGKSQIEQLKQFQQLQQIQPVDVGKKSEIEMENVFEKANEFLGVDFPKNDLSKPLVLGANALWVDESGHYRFIYESLENEHYAIAFIKDISSNINILINILLNRP